MKILLSQSLKKIIKFVSVVETYNGRPDLESYWDTLHFYRAFPIAHCCFGKFSLFWRLFLSGPLLTWSQEVCSLLVTLIGCNKRYVFTKVHWRWAHQTENATFEWYWSFLRSIFRKQGLVEIHILCMVFGQRGVESKTRTQHKIWQSPLFPVTFQIRHSIVRFYDVPWMEAAHR